MEGFYMFKKIIGAVVLTCLSTTAIHASELFNAEDAVKYRQSVYQIFAAQTGVMGAMVTGKMPFDAAEISKRANNIAAVAHMLGDTYFPATRTVKSSNMKDNAWNNMEDFQAKGQNFGDALGKLVEASSQDDFDAAKARPVVGAVLQACKACHDDYRAK